jgi:hypothetical protein
MQFDQELELEIQNNDGSDVYEEPLRWKENSFNPNTVVSSFVLN